MALYALARLARSSCGPAAGGVLYDAPTASTLPPVACPRRGDGSYRRGFRNSFWPSCHAANCALMSSWATASVL